MYRNDKIILRSTQVLAKYFVVVFGQHVSGLIDTPECRGEWNSRERWFHVCSTTNSSWEYDTYDTWFWVAVKNRQTKRRLDRMCILYFCHACRIAVFPAKDAPGYIVLTWRVIFQRVYLL